MHRSGTSCLTGLLADAGVFLGDVSKQNPYNPKGNHENPRIMRLHDEVLAANAGRWDDPPRGEITWSPAHKASLRAILAEYQDQPLWAFKDPRTLFTLSAWQEMIPGMRYIATFRHPSAVAQSLHRRGRMPPDRAYGLWLRYNQRLLQLHAALGFDMLCFDLEPSFYLRAVSGAFLRLGLDNCDNRLGFFEETLRNTVTDPMFNELPPEVIRTYDQLRDVAG